MAFQIKLRTCRSCAKAAFFDRLYCSIECRDGSEVREALRPKTGNQKLLEKAAMTTADLVSSRGLLSAPQAARFIRLWTEKTKL